MSQRWIPLIATTAALALAAVAGAQDRHDDKDRHDRSTQSDRPSRSRSDRDSRDTTDRRSKSDDHRSSTPDRARTGSDASSRSGRNNPFDRSGSRDDRSSRGTSSRPADRKDDSRPVDPDRTSSSTDRRNENRAGSSDRTSSGYDRNNRPSDRTNPFERNSGSRDDRRDSEQSSSRDGRRDSGTPNRQNDGFYRGGDTSRPGGDRRGDIARHASSPANSRGRAVLGVSVHERTPSYWDGRGHAPAMRYGPAPVRNALSIQISNGSPYRGTEVAIGAKIGGLRVGFVSYSDPGFSRGYGYASGPSFGYSHYCYDPYVAGSVVVASPWYRYSYLPPYLDRSNVIVVNDYPSWNWDSWRHYDYESSRDNLAVRDSVDDLRDAFEQGDTRVANRLVPESGNVAIFNEGHYDYSLNPDDFQKMFLDGVEQSKTVRYSIEEVRTRGDEVRVRARHEYTDSWGETQSVMHTITLRRENGGDYVIREFGSE